jgi:hypothetical protein
LLGSIVAEWALPVAAALLGHTGLGSIPILERCYADPPAWLESENAPLYAAVKIGSMIMTHQVQAQLGSRARTRP